MDEWVSEAVSRYPDHSIALVVNIGMSYANYKEKDCPSFKLTDGLFLFPVMEGESFRIKPESYDKVNSYGGSSIEVVAIVSIRDKEIVNDICSKCKNLVKCTVDGDSIVGTWNGCTKLEVEDG